ncbi:hypothetical protein IG631_12179 [Alternaria alternata]|jgi:hypothetical protein|nr:hypothetical protein IG631_12179 [Alternaria alternata]
MLSNVRSKTPGPQPNCAKIVTPAPRHRLPFSYTSPIPHIHRLPDVALYKATVCPFAAAQPLHPTAFGRVKGSRLTTASALILLNLQVVSARPAPHVFNNIPPPRLVAV